MENNTLLFSVGEVSGDLHAFNVVNALHQINPKIQCIGLGGEKLASTSFTLIDDITSMSTVGIIEPIKYIFPLWKAFRKMVKILETEPPRALICIDCQGFNLLLAKKAKSLGIPVIYYIAPQEWQWGTDKGGRKVLDVVDKILAIFPEEMSFYAKLGGNVTYVGHPSVDLLSDTKKNKDYQQDIPVSDDASVLGLFPGSRFQEIQRVGPRMMEAASMICQKNPKLVPVISISSSVYRSLIEQQIERYQFKQIHFFDGQSSALIRRSKLSLITSGTVALEHAILGTPCIASYRFSPITFWLAQVFFSERLKRLPFMTLPNLMLKREVIPELLQSHMTADRLCEKALEFLENDQLVHTQKTGFNDCQNLLGKGKSYQKTAEAILSFLDGDN